MSPVSIETLAQQLDQAWQQRAPIAPFSESGTIDNVLDAYAIQTRWAKLRLARGEKIVGRKIGLTSKVVQQQLGVNEPDYGALWESSYFPAENGQVEIPAGAFLQPKVEGEIAFLMGRSLSGPGVTAEDVLAAAEALALGVEIVDSRIADWRIKLVDTVADNASYGGFTVGAWDKRLREVDLRLLGMLIQHNGEPVAEGIGAAALGHPARSVAWLVNKLAEFGVQIEPGDTVLSGSLARMLPVKPGDQFVFELFSQPALTVRFT